MLMTGIIHCRDRSIKMMNRFGLAALLLTGLSAQAAPWVEGMVLPFKEVVVGAPTEEVIEEIAVKEGDTVKKGDLLAQLVADVEALEVKRFEKILEKREFEFQGKESLFKDKMVSQDEALGGRIERDIAALQHQIAQENYRMHQVISPLDGLVVKQFKEAGESVTETEPLFRIINIDQLYVQILLEAEEVYGLQKGQILDLEIPTLPTPMHIQGQIDFIDPSIDRASGLLRVKLLVDNPAHRIHAGMRVRVALPAKEEK